jgi:hypothetical protein
LGVGLGVGKGEIDVTEQEWLACNDPMPMLEFLRGNTSDRKLLLFACACWGQLQRVFGRKKRIRHAVQLGERFADGIATPEEITTANLALIVGNEHRSLTISSNAHDFALVAASHVADRFAYHAAANMLQGGISSHIVYCGISAAEEKERQASFLRDIINPFQAMSTLGPPCLAWNDGTVVKLAQAICDHRRFQDLPILADALEESGCNAPDLLRHCRELGEHVKGCWAVDLVLGKE